MRVRLIRIVFPNGVEVVGLAPATLSDEEILTMPAGAEITFSDVSELDRETAVGTVLARVAAAGAMSSQKH